MSNESKPIEIGSNVVIAVIAVAVAGVFATLIYYVHAYSVGATAAESANVRACITAGGSWVRDSCVLRGEK